jgi:hypothetical protein
MSTNATAAIKPNASGVRCQNAKCNAKLAEALVGTLFVTCRKCGMVQTIKRQAEKAA